jgi:hypothetical protein
MHMVWQVLLASIAIHPSVDAAKPKPLFADDTLLHLTVTGRLPSGNSATDTMVAVAGTTDALPAKLHLRGLTRQQREICTFPPLRITFAEKPPATSLFHGQKKLKLVTHCREVADFQQYLLLEYAAYRLYNALTPLSYRVRLATIDYLEPGHRQPLTRAGFLIEDTDDLAKRNGLHVFKGPDGKTPDRVPFSSISHADSARFSLFQYMISNLDWAMSAGPAGAGCCHNSRLLQAPDSPALIPVPYDFDFAGMVSPPYAAPPGGVHIASVRVRLYRGYCRDNDYALTMMETMAAKRSLLLGQLDDIPQLSVIKRNGAKAYLDGFFDQIATPEKRNRLLRSCLR